jgi:hypothetical protein
MLRGFKLERDGRQRLVLTGADGERYENVEPVRAFPLSDPRRAISICSSDGREILEIDSLDDLDAATRASLERELAHREFIPVILRILNTPTQTEPATWQVETDRGITTFDVDSEDNVHRGDPHEVSLVDTHGIRYVIPDTRKLDHHSRRVLDRFL